MKQTFNHHEALLALTSVVAWADGENQIQEIDACVQMFAHEGIREKAIETFNEKAERINDDDKIYRLAIATMKTQKPRLRVKAVAWMYQVAAVASSSVNGEESNVEIWETSSKNIDSEEIEWINRARKDLEVSLSDLKEGLAEMPEIQRL